MYSGGTDIPEEIREEVAAILNIPDDFVVTKIWRQTTSTRIEVGERWVEISDALWYYLTGLVEYDTGE